MCGGERDSGDPGITHQRGLAVVCGASRDAGDAGLSRDAVCGRHQEIEHVGRRLCAVARRGDVLAAQIAEAGEIGMADFLDLDVERILEPLRGDRTMAPVSAGDDVLGGFIA